MWTDDWVGIPYKLGGRTRQGMDCVGLVQALLLERQGVRMSDPGSRIADHREALRLARSKTQWARMDTDETCEGDVLVFRANARERLHLGYVVNRWDMIHTGGSDLMATSYSRVDRWKSKHWSPLLLECWRHG